MSAIDRLNAALAGRYEIERELGAGGMATVYLAHDLKHKRKVALKVLKPELAAVLGAERFVVEITTTASLQHPHILALFDSGTADGFLFYVMPWIQGETLREKLNRETQLGVDEAVRIAREVLDALQYAHEHGIVHRDVKPENILLHGGHAMVADFGIALAVSAAAGGRMTETGLSLGTPHYMSPEQATAEKEISARSDVYSLGSVLYEMLTGNPPHVGSSAQQIIMRIITDSPKPVTEIRKSVPPNVAAAVAKSLEKLPADRFESAKAFGEALGNTAYANTPLANEGARYAGDNPRTFKRLFIAASALAAVLLVVAGWEWGAAHRDDARTTVRFELTFPRGYSVGVFTPSPVRISPDGRTIVYSVSAPGGVRQLYARALDEIRSRELPGTDGGTQPVFSPDGRWVAFFAAGQLRKVSLDGGSAIKVSDLGSTQPYGLTWSSSGVIVVESPKGFSTVLETGGTLKLLTGSDTTPAVDDKRWPLALPDGKTVLFARRASSFLGVGATSKIGVLSLETGRSTTLDLDGTSPLGVVDGLLVYANESGGLMAVPFDERSGRVTGSPTPVVTDVVVGNTGSASASMSLNGSLVYQNGSSSSQVVLVDSHGGARPLIPEAKSYGFPRLSPDGKRLAVSISEGGQPDIWIYDLAVGTNTKITTEGGTGERPEWTPDGKRVIYQSIRNGIRTLWWRPADLSGPAEPVFGADTSGVLEGVITPDGKTVVYKSSARTIWYRRLEGDTARKPISVTKFNQTQPRVSPDGKWVAYALNESGAFQVFVQAFPQLGARTQVSTEVGTEPVWSRDGRQLIYRRNEQFVAVTFSTAPTFKVLSSTVLFDGRYESGAAAHANYDIMPDGKQFVLLKIAGEPLTMVVHDWRYELRARMKQQAGKK